MQQREKTQITNREETRAGYIAVTGHQVHHSLCCQDADMPDESPGFSRDSSFKSSFSKEEKSSFSFGRAKRVLMLRSRLLGNKKSKRSTAKDPAAKKVPSFEAEEHHQGIVRFPGTRHAPARWAKIDANLSSTSLMQLLTHQWGMRPPKAIFSVVGLTPPAVEPGTIDDQQYRALRRGLKRALMRTSAWCVTGGTSVDDAGGFVGDSVGNSSMPIIGVLPWSATAEHTQLTWSASHVYGNYKRQHTIALPSLGPTAKPTDNSSQSGRAPTQSFGRRLVRAQTRNLAARRPTLGSGMIGQFTRAVEPEKGQLPLEKRHSHFLLVADQSDDSGSPGTDVAAALRMRSQLETASRDPELLGYGVHVPLVAVLVNGDGASLERAVAFLDCGVPVVVLAGTGGAAHDVAMWEQNGGEVSSTEEADAHYEDCCSKLIPRILEYEDVRAGHRRPLLYVVDRDVMLQEEFGLDFEIMHALLAGCSTPRDEVLLAVAWGEPGILEAVLQTQEGVVAPHPAALSEAGRDPFGVSQALTLALLSGSLRSAQALIDFGATPGSVDLARIFTAQTNRLRLKGATADLWNDRSSVADDMSQHGEGTPALRRASRARVREEAPAPAPASAAPVLTAGSSTNSAVGARPPRFASTRYRACARLASMIRVGDTSAKLGQWEIFGDWVPQYRPHMEVRRRYGSTLMKPTWTDLTMWAVLTHETAMVKPLWACSREPIRAALMACQLCHRLAALPHLRSELNNLQAQARLYEDWALAVLDHIPESEVAYPLLAMLPCVDVGVPLWSNSCLDLAAHEVYYTCKRVVAHRHSQYLLEAYFSGDYSTSRARIKLHTGVLAIAAQLCTFFLPGIFCEMLQPSQFTREESPGKDATYVGDLEKQRFDEDDEAEEELQRMRAAAKAHDHARCSNGARNSGVRERGTAKGRSPPRRLISRVATGGASLLRERSFPSFPSRDRSRRRFLPAETGDDDDDTRALRDVHFNGWRLFFAVPKVKFVSSFMSHIMHIALLCIAVFPNLTSEHEAVVTLLHGNASSGGNPQHDQTGEVNEFEWAFWAWTLLYAAAEVQEVTQLSLRELLKYMRSSWKKLDVPITLCVLLAMALRLSCRTAIELVGDLVTQEGRSCALGDSHWARNMYAFIVLLLFLKLLQYVQLHRTVGVHVIILGRMIKEDVSVFAVIALIISSGVGVALTLELHTWASTDLGDPERDLYERPVFLPFWGLVGLFNHYNMPQQAGSATPTRWLVAMLIFAYLVGIIVLVNLMIAAMSETYVRVHEASTLYYEHERAQQILEFKRKGPLPPPFNLATIIFHDLPCAMARAMRRCGAVSFGKALIACVPSDQITPTDGISRDGFRFVPGPSQQKELQRKQRLAMRRFLKQQVSSEDAAVTNQVSELRTTLLQLQEDQRNALEVLASVQQMVLASAGATTARTPNNKSFVKRRAEGTSSFSSGKRVLSNADQLPDAPPQREETQIVGPPSVGIQSSGARAAREGATLVKAPSRGMATIGTPAVAHVVPVLGQVQAASQAGDGNLTERAERRAAAVDGASKGRPQREHRPMQKRPPKARKQKVTSFKESSEEHEDERYQA